MRWLNYLRFKSDQAEKRIIAVYKLSEKADVQDVRLFASALHDENAEVRRIANNVISILRRTRPAPCIEILLPDLQSPEFLKRKHASTALALLGWVPETSQERVLDAIARQAFDTINPDEEALIPSLLPLLQSELPALRLGAAQTFERFHQRSQDPRLIGPLITSLDDGDLPVRMAALHALSRSTDERRIQPLLKLLRSEFPTVRAASVEALAKVAEPIHCPCIVPLLKDPDFEVRLAAISALGSMKCAEVLEPLVTTLKDSDPDVRKAAVESLSRLRNPDALNPLIAMLLDRESMVRHAAANALQILNLQWQLSKEAQAMIPYLEAQLKSEEHWMREVAAKALNRIRNM